MKLDINIKNNWVWFFIICVVLLILTDLFGLKFIVIPFIAWELTK